MSHTIFLKDVVTDTYTNASGLSLFIVLKKHIDGNDKVELSLKDSTPMSSSFMNSSIGELIYNYGFDKFKSIVKFTDLTHSHADIIRNYLKSCGITV